MFIRARGLPKCHRETNHKNTEMTRLNLSDYENTTQA